MKVLGLWDCPAPVDDFYGLTSQPLVLDRPSLIAEHKDFQDRRGIDSPGAAPVSAPETTALSGVEVRIASGSVLCYGVVCCYVRTGLPCNVLKFGISSSLLSGGIGFAIPATLDLLIKSALYRDFAIALPLPYPVRVHYRFFGMMTDTGIPQFLILKLRQAGIVSGLAFASDRALQIPCAITNRFSFLLAAIKTKEK